MANSNNRRQSSNILGRENDENVDTGPNDVRVEIPNRTYPKTDTSTRVDWGGKNILKYHQLEANIALLHICTILVLVYFVTINLFSAEIKNSGF